MIRDDYLFSNDARAAAERDVPVVLSTLILVFGLLIAAFVIWANAAELEEVTNGQGKIIPAQQVQVVQSLEGGIIAELLVGEGDIVEEGQLLIRLNDVTSLSDLGEFAEQRLTNLARAARLTAEADGLSEIAFPSDVIEEAPELIQSETALYQSRREALASEKEVLRPQLQQRLDELEQLRAEEAKTRNSLQLLEEELTILERLRARGGVPELEVLRLRRSVVEGRDQLEVNAASKKRVQSAITEYRQRLESLEITFRAAAQKELASDIGQLNVIQEAISGARERVTRTEIFAPVTGTVNNLANHTIGGVITPGQAVLEIVPLDGRLIVEAQINPKDVAFVRPGQSASVKLTAYDFTVYGAIPATVTQVSATTISASENEEPYYRVLVSPDAIDALKQERGIEILPGMVASVDILTGEKTVLEYLLTPINKLRSEALTER